MVNVIVTGAAGSLGSAVARRLAKDGHRVALTDIDALGLARTEETLSDAAPLCRAADIRQFSEVDAVVRTCVDAWGQLDAVVNVAGGPLGHYKPIWELEGEAWDETIRTNLTGSFHWIKAAAGPMIAQRNGHIVLVASGSGVRPGRNFGAYAASKAGVIGLMRAAALDLGAHRVKVNAVCPGFIPHEDSNARVNGMRQRYGDTLAIDELSTPDQFADFVTYLLTTQVISAQVMALDSKMLF